MRGANINKIWHYWSITRRASWYCGCYLYVYCVGGDLYLVASPVFAFCFVSAALEVKYIVLVSRFCGFARPFVGRWNAELRGLLQLASGCSTTPVARMPVKSVNWLRIVCPSIVNLTWKNFSLNLVGLLTSLTELNRGIRWSENLRQFWWFFLFPFFFFVFFSSFSFLFFSFPLQFLG
jgi:hypothetical protein